MSFLKIKAFSIDATDSFTFGNANITTTLNGNIANFSGNITGANASLGNLVVANYFSGDGSLLTNITATTAKKIANGTSNVDIASSGGNVTVGVGGSAGIATFTTTGANITGYVNATGNITGANASLGNVVTANYFTGTLTTAAQPNITSVGTLTGLTVNGDITSTGNLIVAGTTTYVNSTITDIKDPIIELGSGSNGGTLSSDDGMDRGSLLHYYTSGATRDAFMGWKNSSGEFTFASNASVSDNVVTVNTLGKIKAGDANLGNLVTSNYFSGNGSLLTSITGANVTGTVSAATTAGTVTTAAQPNITSLGTLTGLTSGGTINFTSASNVSLGAVGNVKITGGTSGYVLSTDGSGNLSWVDTSHGTGNANIAGSNTQIFFNDGGSNTLGASANLTFDKSTNTLSTTKLVVTGTSNLGGIGNITITGGSSGYVMSTNGSGGLAWVAQKSLNSAVDEFTGDGTTVAFTLSVTPTSKNYTFASVQGVMQPKSSYSVSGTTLTFSTAPPNTSLIEVTTLGLS